RTMAESGHTIVHVDSAGCARDAIAVEPFDAAIVDIGLPDESGTSLVCGLRRTGSRLPIVIVTARDSVTDRIDALDLGADDYLVKPFSLLELAARCRAVVRRLGAA
ncbi:response regulator, partial [Escherichia coli]|uniref:response regulator n=6 Tax=Pseudomonadota TaxID=1224 RepID=UPI00193368AD